MAMEWLSLWMFPVLMALVFLGIHVSVALVITAFSFGFFVFGDRIAVQSFGPVLQAGSNFVLAAIPLFVLMGAILERSGIARRLFDAIQIWLGPLPGGLALATVVMCAIFAASAGVVGAVEIVVGLMAIPAMRAYSYDRGLISGTICAGGSLGTIIPPSIVVVVYASIAQLSVGELLAGIMLPGLVMTALFLVYILGRCLLRPQDGPPVPNAARVGSLRKKLAITAGGLLPAALLITAVLGSILMGVASPTEAAAVGALGALILALCYRECSWSVLQVSLAQTVKVTAMIMFTVLGGTMFTGMFAATGGGRLLAAIVVEAGLSPAMLVTFFLLIVFAAGFVLDWISIVLICIPIFAPLVKLAGIDPVWFAVLVCIAIQTSYLTPPMAPSIFYLRAIAPPDFTYGHMYRGIVPFVAMQLCTLLLVAVFPALATWLPKALFGN
jgi:tripartite ATP-independent transporter DctM subunit